MLFYFYDEFLFKPEVYIFMGTTRSVHRQTKAEIYAMDSSFAIWWFRFVCCHIQTHCLNMNLFQFNLDESATLQP